MIPFEISTEKIRKLGISSIKDIQDFYRKKRKDINNKKKCS